MSRTVGMLIFWVLCGISSPTLAEIGLPEFAKWNSIKNYSDGYAYGSEEGREIGGYPDIEGMIRTINYDFPYKINFAKIEDVDETKNEVFIVAAKSKKSALSSGFVKKFGDSFVVFYFPDNDIDQIKESSLSTSMKRVSVLGKHLFIITHELGHVLEGHEASFSLHRCSSNSPILKSLKDSETRADNYAYDKIITPTFQLRKKTLSKKGSKKWWATTNKKIIALPIQVYFSQAISSFGKSVLRTQTKDVKARSYFKKLITKANKEGVTTQEIEKAINLGEEVLNSPLVRPFSHCSIYEQYYSRVFLFAKRYLSQSPNNERNNPSLYKVMLPTISSNEEALELISEISSLNTKLSKTLFDFYSKRVSVLKKEIE